MCGFGVGAFIYILAVRILLKRLGERGITQVGGGLMLLGFLLMASAPVWHFFVIAVVFVGLGLYMMHNTLQTNATQMAPFDRSAAISLFAFALFVGQALGATTFGHVGELAGYSVVFLLAGTGLVILAWFFALARRQYEQA